MSAASQFFGGGGSQLVEVFAVGGGGPGGPGAGPGAPGLSRMGGGGGAGQVVYTRTMVTPGKTYTITIGGASSSTIFADITAYGGGAGGGSQSPGSPLYEGSGGGGGTAYGPVTGPGGTGGSVIMLSPFFVDTNNIKLNRPGSNAAAAPTPGAASGGSALPTGGIPGYMIGIPGTTFGSGGGGGSRFGPAGANGTANTGDGGGGGAEQHPGGPPIVYPAGTGGSGVLIIRFPTAFSAATVSGNAPVTPQPGYYVYRWTSGPGTIVFN